MALSNNPDNPGNEGAHNPGSEGTLEDIEPVVHTTLVGKQKSGRENKKDRKARRERERALARQREREREAELLKQHEESLLYNPDNPDSPDNPSGSHEKEGGAEETQTDSPDNPSHPVHPSNPDSEVSAAGGLGLALLSRVKSSVNTLGSVRVSVADSLSNLTLNNPLSPLANSFSGGANSGIGESLTNAGSEDDDVKNSSYLNNSIDEQVYPSEGSENRATNDYGKRRSLKKKRRTRRAPRQVTLLALLALIAFINDSV